MKTNLQSRSKKLKSTSKKTWRRHQRENPLFMTETATFCHKLTNLIRLFQPITTTLIKTGRQPPPLQCVCCTMKFYFFILYFWNVFCMMFHPQDSSNLGHLTQFLHSYKLKHKTTAFVSQKLTQTHESTGNELKASPCQRVSMTTSTNIARCGFHACWLGTCGLFV